MGAEIGATTLAVRLRRQHGRATSRPPAARRSPTPPTRSPPTCAPTPRSCDPGALLRPGHRDRPRRARAADQRPALPRPRPPGRREVGADGRAEGWPLEISLGADRLVHQLVLRGHHPGRVDRPPGRRPRASRPRPSCSITPGSEQVRATIERDGLLADLEAIGGDRARQRLRPVHRPVGAPRRRHRRRRTRSSTRYNRNFPKRNDGSPTRWRFVTSPDTVIALALAGTLDFDPTHRHAHRRRRRPRCGSTPPVGEVLPATAASTPARTRFTRPAGRRLAASRSSVEPDQRPPAAARAVPAVGRQGLRRPAGADEGPGQVHHRPHLGGRPVAQVPRPPREHLRQPLPRRRQRLHRRGRRGQGPARRRDPPVPRDRQALPRGRASAGCAIGDENYGEGSSREHAAMEPRFRNGQGDLRPQLRPHPRDQPQEAGRSCR